MTILPSTLTFAPIADTYIDASHATSVLGAAPELFVGGGPVRQAFLRFAVSGVGAIPANQQVPDAGSRSAGQEAERLFAPGRR